MSHFIYLLWPREFAKHNEATYKIGKTIRDPHKRLAEYAKGSELILVVKVDDCHSMETSLIKLFDIRFVKRTEYGNEYYSGDVERMRYEIFMAIINESMLKQCLKQKEIVVKNIETLEDEYENTKPSTPKLLKELIPLNDVSIDYSDNESNGDLEERNEYDDVKKEVHIVETNNSINVNIQLPPIKNKQKKVKRTIKTFCKYIYDNKPTWYLEDQFVDMDIIIREYKAYFNDKSTTKNMVSRLLNDKIFSKSARSNGVTKKKLFPYTVLNKQF